MISQPEATTRLILADAAYIRSVLQTISGPIVLVGHSYGGAVITNAAVGVPNVKALVYRSGLTAPLSATATSWVVFGDMASDCLGTGSRVAFQRSD